MKKFKRILSLLLAVLTCVTAVFSISFTAFAASKQEVFLIDLPRGDETNKSGWGHAAKNYLNGWYTNESDGTTVKAIGDYEGPSCYCIEPGIALYSGDKLSKEVEDFWDKYPTKYNETIEPHTIKKFIGRILQYGWTGNNSVNWISTNTKRADECAQYIATQLLIWETIVGERDENFGKVDASKQGKDNIKEVIKSNHPLREKIFAHYKNIAEKVKNHTIIPSFTARSTAKAKTFELKYNGTKYTATITDNNDVLSDYSFSGSGLTFSKSGNRLTITADKVPSSDVKITVSKKNAKRKAVITWTDEIIEPKSGQLQDIVTYGETVNDPITAYLNVKVSYGSAKIVKASEDGNVDGISFHIQGNGIDKTVKTANGGQVQVDNLMPGVYTVTEIAENKYEPQETRCITVVSGQTAIVNFNNKLKRGSLSVTKTSEDGLNEGVKFHLYGTSLSGNQVDEYAVTDKTGKAYFKDVLIGSGYTIEETDTAIRYVVPKKQTADIEWGKVTNKSFNNVLKKWQLAVTKSDKETEKPQGDASLACAKYGVYKGDQLIDTYTTDNNGQFTTKVYICGDDWSLREIAPSEGYLLNTTSLHIGAEANLYTAEYNLLAPLDALETVKKGKIAIIKHCDDGSTQIETPENGAEFEVYLKKSGSYSKAKETERDILVCDENGFSESKALPYGVYTVKQTKGWEGKELIKPFDVFICKNSETYRYLINNATFESLIEIVKKDAETGKIIPASGIGFKVRNTDTGEYIVQHINYPTPMDIEIYYTDSTGKFMMPESLPYGNYELIEQNPCYGYVLDSSPIPFKVNGSKTVVTVEKRNMPQKGVITVTKSGEVFSSVSKSDGLYQPVYKVKGLHGAEYEISAAENIYTPDGTLRYAKGTVVDEITTGKDGKATSKQMYLGKYDIKEIIAPYGMVVNNEVYTVELNYAGQEISITETTAEAYNERQKAEINLEKVLSQDEKFKIGMNGEILSVQFGLFAEETLTAADGSVIPKDGLLEIINCDENGKAIFMTDVPVGTMLYVKELSTDEHYILSNKKYPVVFEYAGQDIALVKIKVNNGEPIKNDLVYGTVKGLKIDRETENPIMGALFGLFCADETEFITENAILTAESNENGVFTFENVPYGDFIICELKPATGYLENTDIYHIQIGENEQTVELTIANDKIPEIGTKADVNGKKRICTTEVFTLTDTVSYAHLIPGKKYVIKGVLMDKSTGKPLIINSEEIHSEYEFTPKNPSGKVTVKFIFDSKFIKQNTDIVVFERLLCEGKEVAVHADIEDCGQTVVVEVPNISTKATVDGKKRITAYGKITIDDVVYYKNLTPGKKYVVRGVLMDKSSDKPFEVDKNTVASEVTFIPEKSSGKVKISFAFDASKIKKTTELVAFEKLYRSGVEIAAHADIDDEGQTVTFVPSSPSVPQTGDESNMSFWTGLCAIAFGGLVSAVVIYIKKKRDEDDE